MCIRDSIWSQPGGDEYYKLRIRTYTTTDFSPEEIHQMGLSEVERISNRMREILTSLGYDTAKSVGEIMNDLNENPDFLYADTPDRKEIVVNDYMEMVDEAIEVMTDYFHTMPKSEVIVKAVPEYSEQTAAGGYYQAPALDGSRPGVWNATGVPCCARFGHRGHYQGPATQQLTTALVVLRWTTSDAARINSRGHAWPRTSAASVARTRHFAQWARAGFLARKGRG